MTLRGLVQLCRQDLAAAPGRSCLSALGIALGIWVFVLIVALGLGARDLVLREVVRELPVDMLEVVPKSLDLGLFQVGAGTLFGNAQPLGPETLLRLSTLPDVAAAYPRIEVPLPMGAQGGARLFGHALYTDLFMDAIPPALVASEVGPDFVDRPDRVPVIISPQLIDIYNASIAGALGTPALGSDLLRGFGFDLVVGKSLMLGSRGAKRTGVEHAEIVGVSRYAMRLGVTVPQATAERLLKTYGNSDAPPRYAAVLVQARSAAKIPVLAQAVEAMGFAVDRTAANTRRLLTAATALCSGVGLLVVALATLNIAHSFVAQLSERRRELAVLRALGARRRELLIITLAQAAFLGLLGGVLGLALARCAAWGVDTAVATWFPRFPFRPPSFFEFPAALDAAGLACAVLASMVGAAGPAWRAAQMAIVRGLAE